MDKNHPGSLGFNGSAKGNDEIMMKFSYLGDKIILRFIRIVEMSSN